MTAVEWLTEKLFNEFGLAFSHNIIEQAKELEKQQIIDAFDEGQEYEYQYHINNTPKFDSQTYFAETYGSKGSDEHHEDNLVEIPTSSQTEISDEEIEIEGWKYCYENKISSTNIVHWITACKWYRKQLKEKYESS